MSDQGQYWAFVHDMFKSAPEGASDATRYRQGYGALHAAVGLSDEVGEVLGHIKKVVFVGKENVQEDLIKELGDVEFYLEALRQQLGVTREEVLDANIRKLTDRHPEGFEKSTFYKEQQ